MPATGLKQTPCPVDISIATRPGSIEKLPGLAKEFAAGVNTLTAGGDIDRKDLLVKCRAMVRALETPQEAMANHCWAQTGAIAAISFGIDSGLWLLMAKNGDVPQKVADLAASLVVHPAPLRRLMRHLGAMGYLIETGEDEYKSTNHTKALSIPAIAHGYLAIISGTSAGTLKFHEFARQRGWTNPTDSKDTSMMYAYGTDKDLFSWLRSIGYGTHLNNYLGGYNLGRLPWMDPRVYPVKENLVNGADTNPDAPFLVDIGGNVGHDIMKFKSYHPDTPGKLILQDLPVVIQQIHGIDPSITLMDYDFHTEQPVKGARAYLIHSCLHNWPDDVCDSILARVKVAMKAGYSKLLINENIVPSTGAYWETTALDVIMLTLFSSEERTTTAWYEMIEKRAGLKIVQIWSAGKGVESLIECELLDNQQTESQQNFYV